MLHPALVLEDVKLPREPSGACLCLVVRVGFLRDGPGRPRSIGGSVGGCTFPKD